MIETALSEVAVNRQEERIVIPGAVIEEVFAPSSSAQVAEIVSAAAAEKVGLLILGGRTRLGVANSAPSIRSGLSLAGVSGIDEFEPDEGVIHAAAGTRIAEIREVVRKEGWELPLDSPGLATTVGGTIASAVTGPRALAFGSVSDAVLGLEVVGGDGALSKCGGRVVKNVTGYDLAKLYCGSYGSLAVVTGAWLRLRPLPGLLETYRIEPPTHKEAFEAVRQMARLTSVRALVWSESPAEETSEVFIELGSSVEGVAHDRSTLAERFSLERAEPQTMDSIRDGRTTEAQAEDEIVLRARVLGSRCEAFRRSVINAGLRVSIDPGLGVVHARGKISNVEALRAIRTLAEQSGGFAIFEKVPEAWRAEVDVFGSLGGTESLVESLKAKFDPDGILNPGRYVTAVANPLVGAAS